MIQSLGMSRTTEIAQYCPPLRIVDKVVEYTFSSTICFFGGFEPKKLIVEKKRGSCGKIFGIKKEMANRGNHICKLWKIVLQIVEITFASCGKSFCKSWKSRLQVVENLLREMIKTENFRLRRSFSKVISA